MKLLSKRVPRDVGLLHYSLASCVVIWVECFYPIIIRHLMESLGFRDLGMSEDATVL